MAKKSKNSKLLVHYTRTMTPENLSRAANYVGGYVLKGLGALGKIFTAPLTGGPMGTNTVPYYPRTVLLANAERKLRETQEELIGKAMTWVSPLNYGAALATGNGLNAKKGEEEVASWSPAWLATARLGELYVGPKGVKVAKAAPRAVVNTAAKAGVKPAKAAIVAREIKLGIKLNTKNGKIEVTEDYFNSPDKWYRVSERPEKIGIELNGKNVTTSDDPGINGTINGWRESMLSLTGRTIPGKGIDEGYFIFLPRKISLSKHGAAHGNTSQAAKGLIWLGTFAFSDKFPIGVIEGLAPVKIFRGMNNLGKDSRTNFVLLNWEDVPLGARVGFHTGEMPMSNLGWFLKTKNGTYTYEPIISEKRITYLPILLLDSPTSLKFFERKPSKISEAEKFGLNKLDRKALSINELLALEDLALYKNSGQYRLVFRVTPDWENFGWNLDRSNLSFLLLFVKDGENMRGPWARVVLQTPTGKGVLAVNPEKNMAGYTSRSFPVPEGMNWAPGEANMMIDGTNGLKIILTAPRTDFFDAIVEKGSESIGEKLPNIIDKSIMKDFWINSRKALRPGTYLSGDNGHAPKGSELIEAFKKGQLHKVDIKERPLNKLFVTRTGLSPDSYSSIIRQGNRDGSLRWGEGFNKWNNSAVENRFINEAFLKLLKGEITPEQYEEIFNNWSLNIGGRELLWKDFNGHKIPVHPHPYIYAKKQGGQIRKMLTAAGGPIYWIRKRLYNNIEPFGYNDVGSRFINAVVLNKNEHDNFKGDYSDPEKTPALYLTIDNIWGEYLHIPEKERRYSNGKYKIKNNGNGTFSVPFESMEDIMQAVNSSNRPLLWGLRGKLGNSVVGEYDVHRGYDKNGDYLKYIDHWRINPYDVKKGKNYGLNDNSLLKWYFKGKDDASFGLGTPVEIQGKYYLDDIYNVKGKDRGGHYLPEIIVTGKKKQGGKMNILEFLKNGSGIHIKKKNRGKFTSYCGGKVTDECILKGKNSSNPAIRKRATFADNARHFKHKDGGIIKALEETKTNFFLKAGNWISNNKDLVSSVTNAGLGIVNTIKLNKAIDAQIEANEKLMEVNKQQAFMDNYKKALGMLSDRSDIVNRNKAWLIANSLNYSDDELLNKNLLLQQSKVGIFDSLGGLSTDILNAFSNKKSSSNNPPSDSYFGNYVKTLFKNPGTFNSDGSFNTSLGTYKWEDGKLKNISNTYGTFNADGSMNLGNGLGTFSIKDGYKPRKLGILNS